MNIKKLMKQAQAMQEKMAKEMAELVVQGSSGGGMVKVTMTGEKRLLELTIDPEVLAEGEVELMQDLILSAVNQALDKVDEAMQGRMQGLGLPGMPGV